MLDNFFDDKRVIHKSFFKYFPFYVFSRKNIFSSWIFPQECKIMMIWGEERRYNNATMEDLNSFTKVKYLLCKQQKSLEKVYTSRTFSFH